MFVITGPGLHVEAESFLEYQRYVHNYLNSDMGNWTYVEKPFYPVILNDSQLAVGQNWSIVCPLQANHSYHIYCYGKWVSNAPINKTNYDIYVYDPSGTLEGYHTASAGLPQHLGSGPDGPFFVPKLTGNYTFTIANDARESTGSQQATFMIIEDVECNAWHQRYIEGKGSDSLPVFNTSWTYEFVTDSQRVEVRIRVPDTLDMYEARLYLMACPTAANYTLLDDIPLAWEPGLYGNRSDNLGGYNTDSQGYEGQAYASCENFGQDMLISFNSTPGRSLYHLVLIGEKGYGNVSFLIKTTFDAVLQPSNNPDRILPGNNATITYISQTTDLENATLKYSTDNWQTISTAQMDISGNYRTCSQVILAEPPGTIVYYQVEALDMMGDNLFANGSYIVAEPPITYLEKPMFPVLINESQIEIGESWSIVCPLQANHSYHAYFYGDWINTSPNPVTDYEIYVYDPFGKMVGYHTPAAGFPPHLGSTINQTYFVPLNTGNYTFVISNDARESKGAQRATFMIIEDVECNVWHQCYIEGKDNNSLPVLNTSWAYEFITESQSIEVHVKVPPTLDMYEARLYVMSNPEAENGIFLDGLPLAWEPGLYGNISQGTCALGGYNIESKEYRGNAYASCEFYGEDMYINFTSPYAGKSLYHLVFIGEVGLGTIDFLVKTEFNNSFLIPSNIPDKAYPGNSVTVAYVSNSTDLKSATLEYSIDDWRSSNSVNMEIFQNKTCRTAIPGQVAGTVIEYKVNADDILENVLTANGSYTVKYLSSLNFTQTVVEARPGQNVTINGFLTPQVADMPIVISIASTNETKDIICYTLDDGTFSADFKAETVGTSIVSARFSGSATLYESETAVLTIIVEEAILAKYSLYIFGGIGAVAAVSIVLYVRKSKG
jgi:hypothetical protein